MDNEKIIEVAGKIVGFDFVLNGCDQSINYALSEIVKYSECDSGIIYDVVSPEDFKIKEITRVFIENENNKKLKWNVLSEVFNRLSLNIIKNENFINNETSTEKINLVGKNSKNKEYRHYISLPLFNGKKIIGLICCSRISSNFDRNFEKGVSLLLKIAAQFVLASHRHKDLLIIQKQLVEQEKELQAVLDNANDAIITINIQGIICKSNQSAQRMFNLSEKELQGSPVNILMSDSFGVKHDDRMNEILNGGSIDIFRRTIEAEGKSSDGAIFPVEITVGEMNRDGERYFVGVLRDITERKKVEKRIHKERDRAQQYLDTVDVIIIALDRKSNIKQINRKGCEVLRYKEKDLLSKNWFDVCIPKCARKKMLETHKDVILGNTDLAQTSEGTVLTSDQEERIILWRQSLVIDLNGKVDGVLIAGEDITQQRALEFEKSQLHRQLQKAQKMKSLGQLTGGIAHDFNNMLVNILGYTGLAKERVKILDDGKIEEYLEEVNLAGERARDLVSKLLAFSRGGGIAKELQLCKSMKDVDTMIKSVIPRSVVIDVGEADSSLWVKIDEIGLQEIIINLCANACQAMNGKGNIGIIIDKKKYTKQVCASCQKDVQGEYIELCIHDNGSGIDTDTLANIFEPFFTTKDVGEGTGMGISVVHGIVHGADGHILVESSINQGSIFRILFPPVEPVI